MFENWFFRNSGHIQQFRVEAISLRAGGGFLCIASTAHSFIYCLIYSRTRAYQTRPAVELVSGEEGSVPEPTSPCTPLPQGSRLGDFAQPRKSARLVVPRVADREDVRRSGPWVAHRDNGAALSVLSRQNL